MSVITDRPTVPAQRVATKPVASPQVTPPSRSRLESAVEKAAELLTAHSVAVLRISLGTVFLVFAAFKYVPGASPAEGLAIATVDKLTLGLVSGNTALLV